MVGYLQEEGIPPESATDTFAAVRLDVHTRRWAGVPFYLRTGKRLGRRVTEIAVVFKPTPHSPFPPGAIEELTANVVVFRIQPDEGVTVRFGSKIPGTQMEVRDVTMDFQYGDSFAVDSPEAYERLIIDVLLGDPPHFPRQREVERSWEILDPILRHWASRGGPSSTPPGGWGPPSCARDDGRRRPRLEAAVINLQDTNGNEVARRDRRRAAPGSARPRPEWCSPCWCSATTWRVPETVAAASTAAREHPMRIIVIVPHSGRGDSRIDARISVGGDQGPGETVDPVAARRGGRGTRLGGHAAAAARHAGGGLVGRARPRGARRWTDRAARPPPDHRRHLRRTIRSRRIKAQAAGYSPGDTDIAWGELTGWRALLASVFDEPYDTPHDRAEIAAPRDTWAAAGLLGAWLHHRLRIPRPGRLGHGPGISMVRMATGTGDIAIRRPTASGPLLIRPGTAGRRAGAAAPDQVGGAGRGTAAPGRR